MLGTVHAMTSGTQAVLFFLAFALLVIGAILTAARPFRDWRLSLLFSALAIVTFVSFYQALAKA